MSRHQRGYIYEAFNAFHVRYYTTIDGVRKQKSHRLCTKDRNTGCGSASAQAVRNLCEDFMRTVSQTQQTSDSLEQNMLVTEFYERHYLPYCEEILPLTGKPRKKPSTMRGYRQIFEQHLKPHFGNITLQAYEPKFGTQLLQSLTGTQRKRTLTHIRAVGSAIFKLAVVEQRIKVNPWHDVVMPDDAIESEDTEHYTMEEAEDIISALVDHADAQLVMALACFLGLGPAEIGGLQWGDVDKDWIHIRRNKYRGQITTPKTKERMAPIPIIGKVRIFLELWRAKCGDTSDGVFVIADLPNMVALVIKPCVKAAGLTWKGLYAGRRGACTAIIEATGGNYAVAQALLRHKKMTTTLNVYKKQITPEAFKAGMQVFQKSLKK
jgi:integrase